MDSLTVHTSHNLHPPTSAPVRLSGHIEVFIKEALKDDVVSVLAKPVIRPPEVRRDLPLADYFVS